MIEGGGDTRLIQQVGKLLGAFPAAGIDDGCAFHAVQDMQQLLTLVVGFSHHIGEVGSFEGHSKNFETSRTSRASQLFLDILYDGGGGCGGKGQHWGMRCELADFGNL